MGVHRLDSHVKGSLNRVGKVIKIDVLSKVMIDANSLLFYLHKESCLPSHYGGEYKEFEGFIKNFFSIFDRDCYIEVVFDGFPDHSKKTTLESRRNEQLKNSVAVWKNLKKSGRFSRREVPIPFYYKVCLIDTLKELKITYYNVNQEADQYIAKRAWDHRFDAILALDTDFFIYKNPGYIPLDTLSWKHGTLPTGRLIMNMDICDLLNINFKSLAVVASFSGNDIVSKEWVKPLYNKWKTDFFRNLVKWVKKSETPWNLIFSKGSKQLSCFELSLNRYRFLDYSVRNLKIDKVFKVEYSRGEISPDVIHIMLYGSVRFTVPFQGIEYCFPEKMQKFRERYYSVIVGNNSVTEHYWKRVEGVQTCVKSIVKPILEFPMMSELYKNPTLGLKVFFDICGIDQTFLKDIPKDLMLIIVALRIMIDHEIVDMDNHDFDALIYHLIYSDRWLCKDLKVGDIDPKPLILGEAFMSVIREVLIVNQICNKPLPHPKVSKIYRGSLLLAIWNKQIVIQNRKMIDHIKEKILHTGKNELIVTSNIYQVISV